MQQKTQLCNFLNKILFLKLCIGMSISISAKWPANSASDVTLFILSPETKHKWNPAMGAMCFESQTICLHCPCSHCFSRCADPPSSKKHCGELMQNKDHQSLLWILYKSQTWKINSYIYRHTANSMQLSLSLHALLQSHVISRQQIRGSCTTWWHANSHRALGWTWISRLNLMI